MNTLIWELQKLGFNKNKNSVYSTKNLLKTKKIKCIAHSTYSINIIFNLIFLKKWYQERYCGNLNFLVTALNKIPRAATVFRFDEVMHEHEPHHFFTFPKADVGCDAKISNCTHFSYILCVIPSCLCSKRFVSNAANFWESFFCYDSIL